jgi:hypothetical protein
MHYHFGIKYKAAAAAAMVACFGLVLLMVSLPARAQYRLTNLVSNQVHQAPNIDPLLPLGIGSGPNGPLVDQR